MSAALLKVIGITGSRRKLAKAIGTTPDAINGWLNRDIHVPLEYAIEIERITAGEVTWPEVATHLAHFAKRWSVLFVTNSSFNVQVHHVALSRITHTCLLQTFVQSLQVLSDDIKNHGLKHPICVDTNNDLIFGEKRLHAYEILGKKTIPAWRLSLLDLMNGTYPKEEISHTFTFSERVAISLAIEKLLGNRQGQRINRLLRQNFVEVKGRTDDFIAKLLSFGNRETYKQAKKVYQLGSHELIEATDQHRIAVSSAALLAQLPSEQQKQILTCDSKDISAFVRSIRHQEEPDLSSVDSSMRKTR